MDSDFKALMAEVVYFLPITIGLGAALEDFI